MKELKGDLWDYWKVSRNYIRITTNGFVKKNGECVMGAGCAHEATKHIPGLAKEVGDRIKEKGNVVSIFHNHKLIIFPVKHVWWNKADLDLIAKSARRLAKIAENNRYNKIILPRPGCNNGQLKWSQVKPGIEPILPDNVYVISREYEKD